MKNMSEMGLLCVTSSQLKQVAISGRGLMYTQAPRELGYVLQSTVDAPSGTSSSSSSSSTSRGSSVSMGAGTGDILEVVLRISSSDNSSSVRFANFTSTSVYST